MVMRTFGLWLVFVFGTTTSGWARAHAPRPPELTRVREYLARQALIRVAVGCGAGMGHQSSAGVIVRGVRELGYAGRIDVVCPIARLDHLRDPLALLFPGFDADGPGEQFLPASNLRILGHDRHNPSADWRPVDLALIGGDDHHLRPQDVRARNLLSLQVLGWRTPPELKVAFDTHAYRKIVLNGLVDTPYVRGLVTNEAAVATEVDQTLLRTGRPFELATFYGHGTYFTEGDQILAYAAVIDHARGPDEPGVVLPVLNTITPALRRSLEERIAATEQLRGRVTVVSPADAEFRSRLDEVGPGRILVVLNGRVPQATFERLFRASDYPPVVGGRNSMNLMALIGRPYLTSNPREGYHFDLGDAARADADDAAARSARSASAVISAFAGGRLDAAVGDLFDFVVAARRPGSAVNALFEHRRLGPTADQDRLVRGLLEVIDLYETPDVSRRLCDAALVEREF